jgi:hypothetical protein
VNTKHNTSETDIKKIFKDRTQNKYYQSRYFNRSATRTPCRMLIVNMAFLQIEHKTTPDLMISDTVNSFQLKDVNFIGRYIW